ncbi:MAG: sensor histidine kinase [Lachnospiraceae bacterium]|nr:sensor histidine kinase [Lachnospiraceae bacterium]
MNMINNEIIQTMYDDLKKSHIGLTSDLNEKKNKIIEIDTYLDSLLSKEESDLRVFLPRKVENIYSDVIEQNKQQREQLVSECDEIERQLHLEKRRIEQLEKILSDDSSMLHVKQLSILDAQEKERQRIARDLHDTSLQNLTHLVHKVELTSLYIDDDPVKAKLELATVEKGIRKVIEEIRNTIFDLRPMSFDDLGLKETIEKLLFVLNQDRNFHMVMDIDPINMNKTDPSAHVLFISIYRIIQECVQNSIKHSSGNEIIVKLKEHDKSYQIVAQDNGSGFNIEEASKKEKHFGLSVIRERVYFLGGNINIDAHNGTCIEIEIPKKNISA